MTAKQLKEQYPLYPTIRRSDTTQGEVQFSTLIRKRFNNKEYYLINADVKGAGEEARLVHLLHSQVYESLMLSPYSSMWILDDNQENEVNRLKNIIK